MADAFVHDLSYKRYLGNRLPQRTRFRVIARNQFATAWKGWFRLKAWLILAAMTAVVVGAIMYLSRNEIFDKLLWRTGKQMSLTDALIPMSFNFFIQPAFMITLLVTTSAITRDLKTGAFEFYFARPLEVLDYLFGKIMGAVAIVSLVVLVPITALAIYRLGLSRSVDELISALPFVPKAVGLAAVTTLIFAVLPLAIGSLVAKPSYAGVVWAGWYLVVGTMCREGLSRAFDLPELAAIDLGAALKAVAYGLFGVEEMSFSRLPPLSAAIGSLAIQLFAGLGILWLRVKQMADQGVGGGS